MSTRHRTCVLFFGAIALAAAVVAQEPFDPETVLNLEPEAFDKEVWRLFEETEYQKLSDIADRACETQEKFPDGTWKIRRFYDGLMDDEHRSTQLEHDVFFRKMFNWRAECKFAAPKSVLTARLLIDYAWGERGSGFADEIESFRIERYQDWMQKANQQVSEALRNQDTDPELYACLLASSFDTRVDRNMFLSYLKSAVSRFPKYLPYYDTAFKWFTPAWYGKRDDIVMLADYCQSLTQAEQGGALYFYIMQKASMLGGADNVMEILNLDWTRIRASYYDFLINYRVSPDVEEAYFLYACLSDDRTSAKESLARLPDDYSPGKMTKRGYDAWAKWARGKGPRLEKTDMHRAAERGDSTYIRDALEDGADPDSLDALGCTPIFLCAAVQDWESVRLLAKRGAQVNPDWNALVSPLSYAAWYGRLDIAKVLLEHGARVDTDEYFRRTPLFYAISNGQREMIELLVEQPNCDVNGKMGSTYSPLLMAARKSELDVVDLLLKHGADPAVSAPDGATPLHIAASYGRVEIAALFLKRKLYDVNVRDDSLCTPLYEAALGGHVDTVRLLLAVPGCDIDARCDSGDTPLSVAAGAERRDVVQLLVEHGADVNVENRDHYTPLLKALNEKDAKMALYLLDHGADPKAVGPDNWTSLMAAADANSLEVTKRLLDAGVDVNARQTDGWTAFHMATMNGQIDILKVLLDYPGAEQNPVTDEGETLLHRAAKNGYPSIVEYLVERGFDINARNADGQTPLDVAKAQERPLVVKVLKELGAEE